MLSLSLPLSILGWIVLTLSTPSLGLPPAEVAPEKVKRAMAYHGVGFATCESNGHREVWTFQRKGQTCSLFTLAFEKEWEKETSGYEETKTK